MTPRTLFWRLIAAVIGLTLLPMPLAAADPGAEIALVLDNSCSMAFPAKDEATGIQYPPNDPQRAAVLGALIVEGLVRGSADRLTVFAFGDTASDAPRVVHTDQAIRELPYTNHTLFKAPLTAARAALDASARDGKLLLFFTDGNPEDLPPGGPDAGDVFGLSTAGAIDTLALGLYGSDTVRDTAQAQLASLARSSDDLVLMRDPSAVVPAFTRGYARTLGSQPVTGTLARDAGVDIAVGKYVTEVLVFAASKDQSQAPITATLTGPSGPVAVQASGDDGCGTNPGLAPRAVCGPLRRQYRVFRAPSDPETASTWHLSAGPGPDVVYGVILRYDLTAALAIPPTVRVGETLPVEARLLFRGDTFDDDAFFGADDFTVTARVGDELVPLTHAGGGRFTGSWRPTVATGRAAPAVVSFRNTWMEKQDRKQVIAEGYLPLTLRPSPSPVVLGTWAGARHRTERCATVSLVGSENADKVPLQCTGSRLSEGTLTCTARADDLLTWDVCLDARPCCDTVPTPGDPPLTVTFAGVDPHYAAGAVAVPVDAAVSPTGFLRCWWRVIALAVTALFTIWFVLGWVRPHSFDPGLSVKVAGSEKGLRRTVALVLCEQPGGRRGFYRDARFSVDGDGNAVRGTRQAALTVLAGARGATRIAGGAALERKDRRTRDWVAVTPEERREGPHPGVVYRLGSLVLKFG